MHGPPWGVRKSYSFVWRDGTDLLPSIFYFIFNFCLLTDIFFSFSVCAQAARGSVPLHLQEGAPGAVKLFWHYRTVSAVAAVGAKGVIHPKYG